MATPARTVQLKRLPQCIVDWATAHDVTVTMGCLITLNEVADQVGLSDEVKLKALQVALDCGDQFAHGPEVAYLLGAMATHTL